MKNEEIFEKLKALQKNSYAPLTNFNVSSIVIDQNNNSYFGVNVETTILTNSICAERNALFNAFSFGLKKGEVKEVHILAISNNNSRAKNKMLDKRFTFPCGACRQAIFEISNGKAKVFVYNLLGEVKDYKINDLLNYAFSLDDY